MTFETRSGKVWRGCRLKEFDPASTVPPARVRLESLLPAPSRFSGVVPISPVRPTRLSLFARLGYAGWLLTRFIARILMLPLPGSVTLTTCLLESSAKLYP